MLKKYFIVAGAGVCSVFGFAPFFLFPLTILALAVLFYFWQHTHGKWGAVKLGFAFGMGYFSAGIGWLYVALHDYGGMSMPLAAVAIMLFAAVLSLYPAAAGYVQARLRGRLGGQHGMASGILLILMLPAVWTLQEWLRGLLFTGFPWLSLGYSQTPYSPLAGYGPLLGVYGVSLLVALSAGMLVYVWQARWNKPGRLASGALLVLWLAGAGLQAVPWTHAVGEPVRVSLLQGNISQHVKFSGDHLVNSLETYRRLTESSDARLVVMPETALPLLREELPPAYVDLLAKHVQQNAGDILLGMFEYEQGQYYNSVVSFGSAASQHYRKNHLVPFGEFIPLRPLLGVLINEVLHIPMGDQARGGERQSVMQVAGQKVAVDICYEDVFGEEIIRYLPEATLLVNATNDAWYGESHAAMQHNQISQMRALETGRMMLRATNTGVTSVIDRDGKVLAMLPQHEEGMLTADAQGYAGSTPYVLWGNAMMLFLCGLMLLVSWRLAARSRAATDSAR